MTLEVQPPALSLPAAAKAAAAAVLATVPTAPAAPGWLLLSRAVRVLRGQAQMLVRAAVALPLQQAVDQQLLVSCWHHCSQP